MAELLTAAQANAETNEMEKVKANQELEIVAKLISDAIHDGKHDVSTSHYGKLNWRTSDKLRQLGYSVRDRDCDNSTLIEWKDVFTEYTNLDEVKSAESEKEFNQDSPGVLLHYIGYSSHDDETWYECPICKKRYSGWRLKNDGSEFECECGQKLYSPI